MGAFEDQVRRRLAAKEAARRPAGPLASPVGRLFDRAMTAYENMRGLNIGGAESGRRARAEAERRNKSRVSIGQFAAQSARQPTPKGAGAQFAPPSAEDIEKMIHPDSTRQGRGGR